MHWRMTRNRRDTNQKELLSCLDRAQYKYFVSADLKHGVPDLVVLAHSGICVLFEVKHDGESLTPDEEKFRDKFIGSPYHIVESCEEIFEILRHYDMQEIVLFRERYMVKE